MYLPEAYTIILPQLPTIRGELQSDISRNESCISVEIFVTQNRRPAPFNFSFCIDIFFLPNQPGSDGLFIIDLALFRELAGLILFVRETDP